MTQSEMNVRHVRAHSEQAEYFDFFDQKRIKTRRRNDPRLLH